MVDDHGDNTETKIIVVNSQFPIRYEVPVTGGNTCMPQNEHTSIILLSRQSIKMSLKSDLYD